MNVQQKKSDALAVIDAALAILNKIPPLDEANTSLSFNTSANPFSFLMDLFKTTAGYDYLLQILSKFIVAELPMVEIAVKGVLISQLKNIVSCSINPFISEELLLNGIVFDLNEIDITDTLRYSPLGSGTTSYMEELANPSSSSSTNPNVTNYISSLQRDSNGNLLNTKNIGKYYYFGCDDCECADDVIQLMYASDTASNLSELDNSGVKKDMNAMLWYMKTRAIRREVWGKTIEREEALQELEKSKKDKVAKLLAPNGRFPKSYGILTFEYNQRSTTLKTATGGSMTTQNPINNCLHVFIGNVAGDEQSGAVTVYQNKQLANIRKNTKQLTQLIERLNQTLDYINSEYETAYNAYKGGVSMPTDIREEYGEQCQDLLVQKQNIENCLFAEKNLKSDRTRYNEAKAASEEALRLIQESENGITIQTYYNNIMNGKLVGLDILKNAIAEAERDKLKDENNKYDSASNNSKFSSDITQNHYYHRTLIELNYDYITSLRLFDSKVIAAQLIDALTGMLSIDLNLSYKSMLIKDEVTKMVNMIIETDDTTVNDCFFTFSNEDYDKMLQKAEVHHAGLMSIDGESNSAATIDADSILNSLNQIDSGASKEQIQTIIQGAMDDISRNVTKLNGYEERESINFGIQMNFIENLLNNLAVVITKAVLSPKVYLIIKINLELLGRDSNFDLETFIASFNQLIVSIIREIRDMIIQYLVNELMKLIGEIVKEIAVKISIEQAMYYAKLIKRIIECFKSLKGKSMDFGIADVDYADIITDDTEEESRNNEC